MASVMTEQNGTCLIQFVDGAKRRRSVRFGKTKPRTIDMIKVRIEQMVKCQKLGMPFDPELQQWLQGLADPLHEKFAKAGLVEARKVHQTTTLAAFLDDFLARRSDMKPATISVWQQSMRNLKGYFGLDRDITTISEADAIEFRQHLVTQGLATTTVSKRLQFVRTFFHDARRRRMVSENPFAEVTAKSIIRLDKRHFVRREEVERLMAVCPDHHWRTIVGLARFGGLRCPSEVLSLRWQDIDWVNQRINVPSPKTEHHGKGNRLIPLFPELLELLRESRNLAVEGSEYVVDERFRNGALGEFGWKSCNLRTQFTRIVRRAGLKPWPKLFHALRSSRETELAKDYPIHVVTAWLGNTPAVAMKHYLLTTDDDFERAARGDSKYAALQISPKEAAPSAAHDVQIPMQQTEVMRSNHSQSQRFAPNDVEKLSELLRLATVSEPLRVDSEQKYRGTRIRT